MQSTPNSKSTPNRRRTTPGRNRNPSQKVHASDNDVPSYKHNNSESPSTPRQFVSNGSIAPQPQSTGQKQRTKSNKNRNTKSSATPAGQQQPDRDSPTFLSQVASAPIFAGSTFHASPAPSELPLPSFLSRSNGDSPLAQAKSSSVEVEEDPLSTDSDEGSPGNEPIPCDEESPLEFFFRADRAEKARVRRASSANTDSVKTTPLCVLQDSPFKECNTFPKTMSHNSHRHPMFTQKDASPGICSNGPDDSSKLNVGPPFSTPYQDRIRAARSSQNSAHSTPMLNHNLDPASTEALKQYLFNGHPSQHKQQKSASSPNSNSSQTERLARMPRSIHQVAQQQHGSSAIRHQTPHQSSQLSPFSSSNLARGMLSASPLTGHTHHRPATNSSVHAVHMHSESDVPSKRIGTLEGDLRRILKLDSPI
ncbi:hypothetical protein F4861DRAFT_117248 [Xylaria intraflava]|nr:hypothetical protein F4861DRAFT_117248 [Xylaria intraflava]